MSKQVRISDEVMKEIAKHAEPLTDTPDKVLRRLLKVKPKKTKSSNRSGASRRPG